MLPALLLRKPPLLMGTKTAALQYIVQRRLNQYESGDWKGLISDFEADVVLAGTMRRPGIFARMRQRLRHAPGGLRTSSRTSSVRRPENIYSPTGSGITLTPRLSPR